MGELHIPLLGRVRLVFDLFGAVCASFILVYWLYGTASVCCVYLPLYLESALPTAVVILFLGSSVMTLASFLKAATANPGRVCMPVQPPTEEQPFCLECKQVKPAEAHHCRRCRQCVLNMDHHCPWINNCVGEGNRYAFLLLIFYTFVLCLTSLALSVHYLVFAHGCVSCDKDAFCVRHGRVLMKVSSVLAALMACSSCGLLGSQHISLIMNTTSLQFMKMQRVWMQTGKWDLEFVSRQRSCTEAYRDVCGPRSFWLWPLPCFKRQRHHAYNTILNPDYTV